MMKLMPLLLLLIGWPCHSDEAPPVLLVAGVELPPFVYEYNGAPAGLIVELLQEASLRTGLPLRFVLSPWPRAMSQIQSGEADVLIPTQYKPERDALLLFPPTPLHQLKFVVVSRPDLASHYQGDVTSLHGQNFVQLRSASIGPKFDLLIRNGVIKPQWTNNFLSITRMIAAERADYSVLPYLAALYYQHATGLNIVPILPSVDLHPVYAAFSKASHYPADLRARWFAAIAAMAEDGTIATFEQSYIKRFAPIPGPD